jgi:hypothetical protein
VERERTVETSVGDITVGMLQWGGYRRIKAGILQFVGEKLGETIKNSFSGLPGGVQIDAAVIAARVVPALAVEIGAKIDDASIDILEACGVHRAKLEQCAAIDVIVLREAAYELNSIESLIEAEKNLLGGLVMKALKTVGFSPPSLSSFGGRAGNQSSPAPGGPEARSFEPQ